MAEPRANLKTPWEAPADPAPTTNAVAVMEGRLVAWIPGKLANFENKGGRHWGPKARYHKTWRERTVLCVKDALNRAKIDPKAFSYWKDSYPWGTGDPKLVVFTAYVARLFDSDDGLRNAIKPIKDALLPEYRYAIKKGARAGTSVLVLGVALIDSDGPGNRHKFEYRQAVHKQRGVEVVVQPWRPGTP